MKLIATQNPELFETEDRLTTYHISSPQYIKYIEAGNIVGPAYVFPLDIQNASVLAEIAAAESATLRAIREYILGDQSAVARLKAADDKIVILRGKVKK